MSQHSGWVPDELVTAGRENLDPAHAASYDTKEDADARAEVELVLTLNLPDKPTILDLGAGTGQFTMAIGPFAGQVIAIDISPVMLDRLRAKVAAEGLANVDCLEAGFLTYDHEGEPADVVYSRYALHHLPDFWKATALQRIFDVLRPGGYLRLVDIVFAFPLSDATTKLSRWIAAYPAVSQATEWTQADLEEHIRDEHSTFTWLLEPMLTQAGFVIERAEYSDDEIVARYVCRRPLT